MKFNRKFELAVGAVKALQNKNGLTSSESLATELGTTKNFMEQVMQSLKRAGITTSVKGPGGGHKLSTTSRPTAWGVAVATGHDLSPTNGSGTLDQLSRKILDVYMNTTI